MMSELTIKANSQNINQLSTNIINIFSFSIMLEPTIITLYSVMRFESRQNQNKRNLYMYKYMYVTSDLRSKC